MFGSGTGTGMGLMTAALSQIPQGTQQAPAVLSVVVVGTTVRPTRAFRTATGAFLRVAASTLVFVFSG